uniref:Myotubularin phosphatase domain-containing protein n=1 Tax=Ascaris lumbricoides TaxID=6252 RepID=A0A0M3IHK2_ASCLU
LQIVWDPVLNKYVGAGVEEETVNTPPPSTANSGVFDGPANGSSGGLRAARISGGSRYFNPLNEATSSSTQRISQSPVPVVTMPIPTTTFGFIPTMPDDESASADSPFSVNASPMETAAAAAQVALCTYCRVFYITGKRHSFKMVERSIFTSFFKAFSTRNSRKWFCPSVVYSDSVWCLRRFNRLSESHGLCCDNSGCNVSSTMPSRATSVLSK